MHLQKSFIIRVSNPVTLIYCISKKVQFHANKSLLCIEVQKDLDDVWSCKLSLFTERPPMAKS